MTPPGWKRNGDCSASFAGGIGPRSRACIARSPSRSTCACCSRSSATARRPRTSCAEAFRIDGGEAGPVRRSRRQHLVVAGDRRRRTGPATSSASARAAGRRCAASRCCRRRCSTRRRPVRATTQAATTARAAGGGRPRDGRTEPALPARADAAVPGGSAARRMRRAARGEDRDVRRRCCCARCARFASAGRRPSPPTRPRQIAFR